MDYPSEDPFVSFGALDPPEQNGVVAELIASAKDLPALVRELAASYPEFVRLPKPVDDSGLVRNQRQLTLIDRKSILYMSQFANPKAGRSELAPIFAVCQQRVSQIVGAKGGRGPDAALIRQFNNTSPADLRDKWRVEAHMQALSDYREGRIAANPLRTSRMTRDVNPLGLWSAYGYQFEVCERDRLYYFRIDAPEEDESNPRNSAKQALDDCFAICRELAWANSSGSQNEWKLAYKEDPLGSASSKNLVRLGD